jgi:Family of unknown function (DUF6232)
MDEQTFFDNNGVKVTNARFIVDANTYAVRNITSTAAWTKPRSWVWAVLCAVIGLSSLANSAPMAIIFFTLAGALFYLGRPVHFVRLNTSGGEVKAVKSYDLEYTNQVVRALNDAMVSQHKSVS